MPRLIAADRNIAIGRLEAGESQSSVARNFNVHHTTISRLWRRYNQLGTTRDRPRSGRPRVTNAAQDRYIRVFHLRYRTVPATHTAGNVPGLRRISAQTIRNRLREHGIRPRRPLVGCILRRHHRQARVRWCRNVQRWNWRHWQRIWFSDESRFQLRKHDGRTRVYRRRNERYARNCVVEADRFGGGSVMVRGAISYNMRSDLVDVRGNLTAIRYRDEVLQRHLLPVFDPQRHVFQQDNARPHVARITMDYLRNQNITVLPWPSKSPDLNPIEHLWDQLGKSIQRRQPQPQTLQQLSQALQEEWTRIPQARIQRLIMSMPRRCQAVLNARGGHNRY